MRIAPLIPVSIGWSGPKGLKVELVGDFPDWKYPIPMNELTPGQYRCDIELEPGLYRYKFRVDGRLWVRDPRGRVIDAAEGLDNSILVVGGSTPPLLFAPDRRHLALLEDGRAVFHVEVADATANISHVWIRDSGGQRLAPLETIEQRGDWRMMRAETQVPLKAASQSFFGFSGAPEQVFRLPPPRLAEGAPPAWLDRALFYFIFVDRWHRAASSSPFPGARSRMMPSTANTFYGGDLDGIAEGLGYLQDLGVNAVVLTPIHVSASPHRYDATDLLRVDPAIGGEPALERLLERAHSRGMKVVVDVAVTHLNDQHPAFQDVLARQQRSKYASWFRIKRFPVRAQDGSTFEHYFARPDLPWLDLKCAPARRHVFKAVDRLIALGVDGLRLDAMHEAPLEFWGELREHARDQNPDLLLLGEVVSDNLAYFAEERGVDVATDFRHREAMIAFFGRAAISASDFWKRTFFDAYRAGPFDPSFRLLFLDNHDTARFLSLAVLNDRLRLALAYLMIRPEPVGLTYGTEFNLASGDPAHVLDDAWPERLPMPPLSSGQNNPTLTMLRELGRLRQTLEPLQGQQLRLLQAEDKVLGLERSAGGGSVLQAWFNAGDQTATLRLPPGAETVLEVNAATGAPQGVLPGRSARFVVKKS